jgi:hypothetical protein
VQILQKHFSTAADKINAEYQSSAIENHNPDTGSNREEILIKWLKTYLPRTVEVYSGGKIIDSHDNISKQSDVIIYDSSLIVLGDLPKRYYFSEGVISAIEVKSVLTKPKIKEAFENSISVKKCQKEYGAGVFFGKPKKESLTGLFAFDAKYKDHDSLLTTIKEVYGELEGGPDFICVNKKAFYIFNHGELRGTKADGTDVELPHGYCFITNEQDLLWRMLFMISGETKKVLSNSFDIQKYFFKQT